MKVYSLKTNGSEHNVPITNNGKNIYIKFVKNYWKDKLAYYRTDIASLIESIEKSKYFLSGDIKLVDIPEEQIVSEERAAKIAAELAEQKAKEEAEAAELAEQKAKEEAEAAELAEQKAKEEAEAAELAERKAKEEAEAAELAEQKAKEEAEAAELAEQKAKEEAEAAAKQNTVVHAEVTKFQEAKKILQAEPYKVAHQALGSPDKVFKKAAELGISFPNLKIDEE